MVCIRDKISQYRKSNCNAIVTLVVISLSFGIDHHGNELIPYISPADYIWSAFHSVQLKNLT